MTKPKTTSKIVGIDPVIEDLGELLNMTDADWRATRVGLRIACRLCALPFLPTQEELRRLPADCKAETVECLSGALAVFELGARALRLGLARAEMASATPKTRSRA
jgi:hypothetical protein